MVGKEFNNLSLADFISNTNNILKKKRFKIPFVQGTVIRDRL